MRTWSTISKAMSAGSSSLCGSHSSRKCLEFYKTERSVRTASSEQVRRPIFKEGLDQWRHFEPGWDR